MGIKVGIDVGGTFTDFIVADVGAEPVIHKALSTPEDPSIAVLAGLQELAARLDPPRPFAEFIGSIDTVVHGTTVATNATLTHTGARSVLLTTRGVRDALEMRRGIRERQYDNRYTNVKPLVPRYLRIGVGATAPAPKSSRSRSMTSRARSRCSGRKRLRRSPSAS